MLVPVKKQSTTLMAAYYSLIMNCQICNYNENSPALPLTVLYLHHETPFKFLTFCTIMMRHIPGCIIRRQLIPSSCACFLSLGLYSGSSHFCMFRTLGQEVGTDTCEAKGKLRKEVGLSGWLPFGFLWPEKLCITS